MTKDEVLTAMDISEQQGSLLALLVRFQPEEIQCSAVRDHRVADGLLSAVLGDSSFADRFKAEYDYLVVWEGFNFYAAVNHYGKLMSRSGFLRYMEEWSTY